MAKNAKVSNAKSAKKETKKATSKATSNDTKKMCKRVEGIAKAANYSKKIDAHEFSLYIEKAQKFIEQRPSVLYSIILNAQQVRQQLTAKPCKHDAAGRCDVQYIKDGQRVSVQEHIENINGVAALYGLYIFAMYRENSSNKRIVYITMNNNGEVTHITAHETNDLCGIAKKRYDNQEQTTDYSSNSPRFAAAMAAGTVASLDEEYKEYHDNEGEKRHNTYMKKGIMTMAEFYNK